MGKRKVIGYIVANPEATYQQRVFDGLFAKCRAYGYDLAVFSPLVSVYHQDRVYLRGELNIFELINFDLLDAVIVAPISLDEDNTLAVEDYIEKKLAAKCRKPVVALDKPMNGCETVYTDDVTAFYEIARHIITDHGCRDIYFLNGPEGTIAAERRFAGFKQCMEKHGLEVKSEKVFYGDFWYSGGEALADRIVSGELAIPEAVICASDHMAIGLVNRLVKHGIKVPEQVIVVGYEATQEALVNDIIVTSYVPRVSRMAAEAVDKVRMLIEPGEPIVPCEISSDSGICVGETCGCREDIEYLKERLNASIYKTKHNYSSREIFEIQDIGRLMESYMLETLTASRDPQDCLERINLETYLLRPYDRFYMCLRENWLDTDESCVRGYPEKMRSVIHSMPDNADGYDESLLYYGDDPDRTFETSVMLPQLFEEHDKPGVFYFAPLHFQDNTLGYTVLVCALDRGVKINNVFHSWIRNVNNALEMTRVQNRLMSFSVRDNMTGLYNRRGMELELERLRSGAAEGGFWLAAVIDMDGLKYINDTYGHSEGDRGIMTVAAATKSVTGENELCVRTGGDEFYIIGLGDHTQQDAEERVKSFEKAILRAAQGCSKPYEITASIGCCVVPAAKEDSLEEALQMADYQMYQYKTARKKHRS